MSEFSTGFATEDDKEELVNLQTAVGGGFATAEDFEHWYLDHPFGAVTIPIVRAPDGSLAGAAWIFPMRVGIGDDELDMGNGANLHVHPRYRDSFAYPLLSRHLGRTLRQQVPLHFSLVSPGTYRRQRGVDPGLVANTPWLLRVLDPAALAERYARIRGRSLVAPVVRAAAHTLFRRRAAVADGPMAVHPVSGFDERFDTFWTSVRSQHPITLVRDRDFLRWRFAGLVLRSYETFVAETSTRMLGYLVLRRMEQGGVGHIVDFLVADGPEAAQAGASLIGAVEDHCRARDVTALSTALTSASLEASLLLEAGFRPNPFARINRLGSFWPQPLRCALFLHDVGAVPAAARRARNWYVTLAHHEMI